MKSYEEKCRDLRKKAIWGFVWIALFAFAAGVACMVFLLGGSIVEGVLLGLIYAGMPLTQCYFTLKSMRHTEELFKK